MAIDYDHLMNYDIPEVRHVLTRRDTAFYALSVGFGHDPMKDGQLKFVNYHRDSFSSVPSMSVIIGHPGFWLSNPDTGVDALQLVHGEQEIELLGPLPVEGEFRAKTRVVDIVDKGRETGALLYSEKAITDHSDGKTIAITRSTTFLRGNGGFGGPSARQRQGAPASAPTGKCDLVVDLPTRPEQALYYRQNGDPNPLHTEPEVAARAGFPRPILQGLCTFGVVTHALMEAVVDYDPAGIAEMGMRFSAPVFPGETVRTEIWEGGHFRAHALERDVTIVKNGLFRRR